MISKNLLYLIVGIMFACVLIFLTCFYSMNKNFDVSYKKNLQIQANFISAYISDEKARLYLEATSIADSSMMRSFFHEYTRQSYDNLVSYIEETYDVNITVIVDEQGVVLFGGEALPEGYKVSVDLMVKALGGKAVSDIVNFKKNGISICAAAPIIIDKKIVGALMIGDLLKTNNLVDKIKMLANIDMTVFDGDTRISTTILQNGQRAIGTRLENYEHIIDIVDKKTVYNDDVDILGVPYKAIYWPLLNNASDRVGLLFLGNRQDEARQRIVYSSLVCFIISGIISVLICLFSIYFFNGIVNPLKERSITDNLTGVLNRHGIESLFNIAFRRCNGTGCFILVDLDNFKDINDTLGHSAGDQVLKRTARELKTFFRHSDVVGRFGGDEFIVYAPDLIDYKIIRDKIRDLVKLLRYGYNLDGNDTLFVTASIGIAICPKDGTTYRALLHKADLALYEIKETGRNGYGFFGEGRSY
ncbi:MAG: diguanylate cyclase [Desulfovibrio sp.]|nr:diguanylate cyclase [Desulfovibrio sp.]